MQSRGWLQPTTTVLAVLLCVFTLIEVNYPILGPQARLATFALFGLVLCFLHRPLHPKVRHAPLFRVFDGGLILLAVAACGFIIIQSEPAFRKAFKKQFGVGPGSVRREARELAANPA